MKAWKLILVMVLALIVFMLIAFGAGSPGVVH